MTSMRGKRKAVRWLVLIAGGVLVSVLAGWLISWQLAPMVALMYFCGGWAADRGQKHKREVDAYREEWLNRRKSHGDGTAPPAA
jgi:hypothetical protein